MQLVKLTFWHKSKLQFVLTNTFLYKLTPLGMLYHDFFRNCLVHLNPCITQHTGFKWGINAYVYLLSLLKAQCTHSSSKVKVKESSPRIFHTTRGVVQRLIPHKVKQSCTLTLRPHPHAIFLQCTSEKWYLAQRIWRVISSGKHRN